MAASTWMSEDGWESLGAQVEAYCRGKALTERLYEGSAEGKFGIGAPRVSTGELPSGTKKGATVLQTPEW